MLKCISVTLLTILIVFCFYDTVLYRFRSPENGLPITSTSFGEFQTYLGLSQDSDGHIYAIAFNRNVVRLGVDGVSEQHYHLNMFDDPKFNVVDGVIQIYDNGVTYEYDEAGNFIRKYVSESGAWLPVTNPLEYNGKWYTNGWSATDWIVNVKMYDNYTYDTSGKMLPEEQDAKVVLSTFSVYAKAQIIKILFWLCLTSFLCLLLRYMHRKIIATYYSEIDVPSAKNNPDG